MSRAAPFLRRPSLFTVVCVTIFLLSPFLHTAVSAATYPTNTNSSSETNGSGWVINEVHADPANDLAGDANGDGIRDAQQDEFVELFNNTGGLADISGWTLADEYEVKHTFPQGSIVPDQCAIVVFGGGNPAGLFGHALVQIAGDRGLGLDNTGDTVTLSNGLNTVQSMYYGFEGNEDQSLTRNPDVNGAFEGHMTAGTSRYSPGTQVGGASFWGCDAPPVVLETQPADGAEMVPIDGTIVVTFSEPVTLSESWHEIACSKSGIHTAVSSGSDASYKLTPNLALVYEEICRVTLFGAAITDIDGVAQPMGSDMLWQFTTETEPDNAPRVMDSYPVDGAAGVATTTAFAITFSEPVSLAGTAVNLNCRHGGDAALAISGGPLQFQIVPDTELELGDLCTLAIEAAGVTDLDVVDPPDQMTLEWQIGFSTGTADFLLINEVDSETQGHDNAEFIELFDGGRGRTWLDGLSLILFSGHDDRAYASFDLTGQQTDDNGYLILGSSGVAGVDLVMDDSLLQNGADAIALYRARATEIPLGTPVTEENLLDALVYDTNQATDTGLLPLLHPGEVQVNEDGRSLDDFHSLQRCPDGSGGQRRTATVWPDLPTPKKANTCVKDKAPQITGTAPAHGASGVPLDSDLVITFSEEVDVSGDWFDINCQRSGRHEAASSDEGFLHRLHPTEPFVYGEQCRVTIFADKVHDLDTTDPPDHPASDYAWSFTLTPARHMLINEVDADSPGVDTAEFVELYDGGRGNTPLDGLVLVLFNGADDVSYGAIDLNSRHTDEQGRFVIGSAAVSGVHLLLPDGAIQNGADAVALYEGSAQHFPNGSAISTDNLLDAVVYGTADEPDSELLTLLAGGEQQLNEDDRGNATGDSNQRCPDGVGGQRRSASFLPNLATPGQANKCSYDAAPALLSTTPDAGESGVAVDSSITLNFSEQVDLEENWIRLECEKGGRAGAEIRHFGNQVILKPLDELPHHDLCTVTVLGARVHDSDLDDPPDHMTGDYSWTFETISIAPAHHVLINELDADTPGEDTAEFIELYDGGHGNTALDGLVVILFNGSDDLSYKAIDLDGYQTDAHGYFLLGNPTVPGVDHLLSSGTLQNGPDAAALYVGDAVDFPHGTAITTNDLLDALIYSSGDENAPGLMSLLLAGELIVDENGRGAKVIHSNQRCPNSEGGQRRTGTFLQNTPTPKVANFCRIDPAPSVTGHHPSAGANNVARDRAFSITFSEAVSLVGDSIQLQCTGSGLQQLAASGGPNSYSLHPDTPLAEGELCTITVFGDKVSDLDDIDPPDNMIDSYSWSFTTLSLPIARDVLINEVDADTAGEDTAEFIELYDGGQGSTALDGLVIVLFNGNNDLSYKAIDLDGYRTDTQGYFAMGNLTVPGADHLLSSGTLQNGPDAAALYVGNAADFPNGTAVSAAGLLDALVYSTGDESAPGLMPLLLAGELIVNEDGRGAKDAHSNQRCPNGAGQQRRTAVFLQNTPTPKAANFCTIDKAPAITNHQPPDGAGAVPKNTTISVTFSEAVSLAEKSIALRCDKSGDHELASSGGPAEYSLKPDASLMPGETCTVTVFGDKISDQDNNDPPDNMAGDYAWSFEIVPIVAARHVLINEVDADTPGADSAEFIELYDGGKGNTALDGLQIVLFNGADDQAFRHINLTGYHTSADGYFVIGGSAVASVGLEINGGTIQNGPDAVALFISDEYNTSKPDEVGLLDALVYHTNDEADPGLDFLLLKNEPQVNEGQWRDPVVDSNQRCPNGQGGQRVTSGYVQNQPTPGTANNCKVDKPPSIADVFPADGVQDVPLDSSLAVHFDEPVQVSETWITLSCAQAGLMNLEISGGSDQYTIKPLRLASFDDCMATIAGSKVRDLDGHADPLDGDYSWNFSTGKPQTALSAGFTSSSPVTIGEAIHFLNASHGPQPLTYEWDFGDSSPLVNEVNPHHLYTAVGTFTVTLMVKTSWGETAVFSAPVEIRSLRVFVPLSTAS